MLNQMNIKDFTKAELIDIIEGLNDIIHGRVYTNEEVKKILGI